MKLAITIALIGSVSAAYNQSFDVSKDCGPCRFPFRQVGSSTVSPLAEEWQNQYKRLCSVPNNPPVGGKGSTSGAEAVCAKAGVQAVEIGDMSRQWAATEAKPISGKYQQWKCQISSQGERNVFQVDVAIDGITVVVKKDSTAERCFIDALGGLKAEQLRWIYSDSTTIESDSSFTGKYVPNSDSESSTRKFNELSSNSACPGSEIVRAGADSASGTHEFFADLIFNETSEHFKGDTEESSDDSSTVNYVKTHDLALGYFGYSYYEDESDNLAAVPIYNPSLKKYITPNAATISNGEYIVSRRIYMNFLNDPHALARTAPFLKYAWSTEGDKAFEKVRYFKIPLEEREKMWQPIAEQLAKANMKTFPCLVDCPCYTVSGGSGIGGGNDCRSGRGIFRQAKC